ncbi:MAG: YceI family protein [Methylocystaceae bacterium]|nr:YceI family protein [Methylocystaceae bacterium]
MFRIFFLVLTLISTQAYATDWVVRPQDSKLGFFASQGGAEFEGKFNKFDSDISFDPENLAQSSVKIVIYIESVDTQSADRDSNIVTEDWFNTKTYPTALFEVKNISKDDTAGYIADAELTMRGVKKDVKLPFSVEIEGNHAHAKGELVVSRTAFGLGQGQWASTAFVGDEVRIFFDLNTDAKS